jgi:hypothetical protein
MLDKIRAHQRGELPEEYLPNLGHAIGLDGRMCSFLGVTFAEVCTRVAQGGTDEEILVWCCEHGGFHLTEERVHIWNEYARKVGWNDVPGRFLRKVRAEDGLEDREDLVTAFDVIDHREGRKRGTTKSE